MKLRHDILGIGLKENAVLRALYIYQEGGEPKAMLATHVDDMLWATKPGYEDRVQQLLDHYTLKTVVSGTFRFCGRDVVQQRIFRSQSGVKTRPIIGRVCPFTLQVETYALSDGGEESMRLRAALADAHVSLRTDWECHAARFNVCRRSWSTSHDDGRRGTTVKIPARPEEGREEQRDGGGDDPDREEPPTRRQRVAHAAVRMRALVAMTGKTDDDQCSLTQQPHVYEVQRQETQYRSGCAAPNGLAYS